MSDFDEVLERLLVDPAFKAALAADPAAALAGYRLSADELELLGSQLSIGDGEDRTVETRSSKSSIFGLLGPLGGLAGGGTGGHPAGEGFGPEWHQGTGGGHPGTSPFGGLGERLGSALNAPGAAEGGPVGCDAAGGASPAFSPRRSRVTAAAARRAPACRGSAATRWCTPSRSARACSASGCGASRCERRASACARCSPNRAAPSRPGRANGLQGNGDLR